ncbi:MAG: hypothetical protein ACPGKS_02485 [Coraliomargarita sp.]
MLEPHLLGASIAVAICLAQIQNLASYLVKDAYMQRMMLISSQQTTKLFVIKGKDYSRVEKSRHAFQLEVVKRYPN